MIIWMIVISLQKKSDISQKGPSGGYNKMIPWIFSHGKIISSKEPSRPEKPYHGYLVYLYYLCKESLLKMCFLRAPEVDACNCDSLPQQVFLIFIFWSKIELFVTKCVFRSIIRRNQRTTNLQDRRLVWGLSHSWHLGCCCWQVLTKHCQRHNGPEGCVLVAKVTNSQTNFDQSFIFIISTKQQLQNINI